MGKVDEVKVKLNDTVVELGHLKGVSLWMKCWLPN